MIAFEGVLSGVESTVIFIAVLSILIVVHEWGHFITAKLLGVKVDEFALGFGPTLWAKEYHGTNYMLKLFPLGGYVRMAGDERAKCTGAPDEYYSKSPGKRALVVFNGPLVNFILAYVSFIFVFMLGYPGISTTITEVVVDGPAHMTQIRPADELVAINGKKIYGWLHLERLLEGKTAEPMKVTVKRNGALIESTIQPVLENRPSLLGIPTTFRNIGLGFLPNKIGDVGEDSPAQKAGLQMDDIVIEIDSKVITNWTLLQEAVASSKNETIHVKFSRGNKIYDKDIVPEVIEVQGKDGQKKSVRRLGIGPQQDFGSYKFNFFESCYNSLDELWYITKLTYEAFYRMITGAVSPKESVTGPVGIFFIVKGAAEAGFAHLLFILAVISASLAIFNLLPMLPLDGGHLALLFIEKMRGKPLPEKIDEFFAKLGFSLIILLALFVFYNDFSTYGIFEKIKNLFSRVIN